MVSPIKEEAEMMQLLPLKKADFQVQIPADIPMEQLSFRPSPEKVMNQIIPGYIEGFVYGALVESYSCEQNARMMAMESATKSAKDMQPCKASCNYSGNYRGYCRSKSPKEQKVIT